jgi:hypothetical protein
LKEQLPPATLEKSMHPHGLTRRRFVAAVAALTAGTGYSLDPGLFFVSRAWAESGGEVDPAVRDAMVRMARLLYPHEALPDDVYAGVLEQALADVAAGAAFATQLDEAAAALNAQSGNPWRDLDTAAQIEIMQGIEDEAFFAAIQNQVRAGIYMGAAYWKHVGYPGPSKDFGGYLRRGAGEIDWLPGDS